MTRCPVALRSCMWVENPTLVPDTSQDAQLPIEPGTSFPPWKDVSARLPPDAPAEPPVRSRVDAICVSNTTGAGAEASRARVLHARQAPRRTRCASGRREVRSSPGSGRRSEYAMTADDEGRTARGSGLVCPQMRSHHQGSAARIAQLPSIPRRDEQTGDEQTDSVAPPNVLDRSSTRSATRRFPHFASLQRPFRYNGDRRIAVRECVRITSHTMRAARCDGGHHVHDSEKPLISAPLTDAYVKATALAISFARDEVPEPERAGAGWRMHREHACRLSPQSVRPQTMVLNRDERRLNLTQEVSPRIFRLSLCLSVT